MEHKSKTYQLEPCMPMPPHWDLRRPRENIRTPRENQRTPKEDPRTPRNISENLGKPTNI